MWAIAAGLIWEVCLVITLNRVPSQITKGYEFESETDTEVIPKLIKYVYDNREGESVTFSTLVERVIQQLVSRCTIPNVTTQKHRCFKTWDRVFVLEPESVLVRSDWTVNIFI